jgi:GDPmannose 4,6-dehydratase
MKKKIALIFGVTGQDGSYLAEFLIKKNYIVHGVKRRSSSPNTDRIDHIFDFLDFKSKKFFLHYGDLSDVTSLLNIIYKTNPDEIYNLAAQSHVKISSAIPEYTANITGLGSLRILEIIRFYKKKKIKFYQASSSEMFGSSKPPQNENTKFLPCSMYAISKIFSFHTVKYYRDAYKIHACNGILFNHESPRRGVNFVTKKIVDGLMMIKKKKQQTLLLGNLDATRDWGHAKEYVESMWKILQSKKPRDYVVGTGKSYSVKQFLNKTAKQLGMKIIFKGKGLNQVGIDSKTNKVIIRVSKKYFREKEVDNLRANSNKIKKYLKWKPKYSIDDLISDMIKN